MLCSFFPKDHHFVTSIQTHKGDRSQTSLTFVGRIFRKFFPSKMGQRTTKNRTCTGLEPFFFSLLFSRIGIRKNSLFKTPISDSFFAAQVVKNSEQNILGTSKRIDFPWNGLFPIPQLLAPSPLWAFERKLRHVFFLRKTHTIELGPCCMKPWMDRPFLANRLGWEGRNQRRLVGCCWVGLIRKKNIEEVAFLFTKNMQVEKTVVFFGKLLSSPILCISYCQ